MSSLSQNVLTLLVKYFFWSLLCSKYKYTHTHTHTHTGTHTQTHTHTHTHTQVHTDTEHWLYVSTD